MTDVQLAQQFVRRKRLGDEWLAIAWFGIEEARGRFDPARGRWITCARIGIAGRVKNLRRKMARRYKTEFPLDDFDLETSTKPHYDTAIDLRRMLARIKPIDAQILQGLMEGMTYEEVGTKHGFDKKWAWARVARLRQSLEGSG